MKRNNNISLSSLFSAMIFGLIYSGYVIAGPLIDQTNKAEAACKELSEESLTEMGLAPEKWRSQASNEGGGFSIEGQWQTKNGRYFVECEVGFGKSFDDVEVSISKD